MEGNEEDMGRKNRRKKSAQYKNPGFNPNKYLVKQNNDRKKFQDTGRNIRFAPQRGDIWFAELGEHPGTSVQEGCRPVFIVSNDTANGHSGTVTVVPLTSRKKKIYLPTHVLMEDADCPNLEPSMVLAEQVTTIGKCALKSFVGNVSKRKIHEIERAVEVHLGLTLCCGPDGKNYTVCKGV